MQSRDLLRKFGTLRLSLVAACFCVASAVAMADDGPAARDASPLDAYVAKKDDAYSWKLTSTIRGDGFTTFVVDLKSQRWRTEPEVSRAVWQHWLVVVRPDKVEFDTAHLRIGGGRNGDKTPGRANPELVRLALATKSVVADLGQVPNQPLVIDGDGHERVEDDLIAYCWNKQMDSGDATWIPRFAMVKSAVRAMDAVTELLASDDAAKALAEVGGKTPVRKFVVSGGSKRGWTTWLTGAVDSRVVAIVPAVIDVLNVRESMNHHFEAYGFWSTAVGDYTRHKIVDRIDDPKYTALLKIEDPINYRDRLTMPKFIVNAAGDQYFLPDSSRYYFDDLKGPKYLRYVPNTNHSLRDSDAADCILAFHDAILRGTPLPKFDWKIEKDGSIRVRAETKPREVRVWQATNPTARDFRLDTIGAAYKQTPLEGDGDGRYVARVEKPEKGWTASFVELVFDSGGPAPFKFTSGVSIVPDTLPHTIDEFRQSLK